MDEPRPKARRLTSDARRSEILEKAVAFFAEEGFESSTRRFASRIGITQPLLYRYFPSKDHLIAEVYDKVYLHRWQPAWDAMLRDRTVPIRARLNAFYDAYTEVIYDRDWLRIYLFSGLRGAGINRRYMQLVRVRVLEPVVEEIRHAAGMDPAPPRPDEVEFAWVVHGGIFYYGVRDRVYETAVDTDKRRMIAAAVEALLHGIARPAPAGSDADAETGGQTDAKTGGA